MTVKCASRLQRKTNESKGYIPREGRRGIESGKDPTKGKEHKAMHYFSLVSKTCAATCHQTSGPSASSHDVTPRRMNLFIFFSFEDSSTTALCLINIHRMTSLSSRESPWHTGRNKALNKDYMFLPLQVLALLATTHELEPLTALVHLWLLPNVSSDGLETGKSK